MVVLTQEAALLSQSSDSYLLQTSTHFPLPSWYRFPSWTGDRDLAVFSTLAVWNNCQFLHFLPGHAEKGWVPLGIRFNNRGLCGLVLRSRLLACHLDCGLGGLDPWEVPSLRAEPVWGMCWGFQATKGRSKNWQVNRPKWGCVLCSGS